MLTLMIYLISFTALAKDERPPRCNTTALQTCRANALTALNDIRGKISNIQSSNSNLNIELVNENSKKIALERMRAQLLSSAEDLQKDLDFLNTNKNITNTGSNLQTLLFWVKNKNISHEEMFLNFISDVKLKFFWSVKPNNKQLNQFDFEIDKLKKLALSNQQEIEQKNNDIKDLNQRIFYYNTLIEQLNVSAIPHDYTYNKGCAEQYCSGM